MRVQYRWPVGCEVPTYPGIARFVQRPPQTKTCTGPQANVNSSVKDDDMKKKKTKRTVEDLTLDDFLKEEGKLEEFEAVAIKEVLAWQIAEAMTISPV